MAMKRADHLFIFIIPRMRFSMFLREHIFSSVEMKNLHFRKEI